MTIRLKKIELSNIRSHEKITFKPELEGITALRGSTGTGKSTIVDSIAWALYGTKPSGVSKASDIYRSTASFPKDKCYAIVELEVDDTVLKIERKMVSKGGAVECNVSQIEDDGTEKHLAGPAVSHAEDFIRKHLKMNERGFLSAILVQQKQVDHLVLAAPRERGEIIEKLTGVSSLTYSLDSAKQELNSLKKAIDLSAIDHEALPALETELETLIEDLANKTEKHSKISQRYGENKESLGAKKKNLSVLGGALSRKTEIERLLDSISGPLKDYQARLQDLIEKKTTLRSFLAENGGVQNYEAALKPLNKAKASEQELRTSIGIAANQIKKLDAGNEKLKTEISKSDFSNVADIDELVTNLSSELEELDKKRQHTKTEASILKSNGQTLQEAIRAIATGGGECPTCQQTVEEHSADKLKTELHNRVERVKELTQDFKNFEKAFRECKVKLQNAEVLQEKYALLKDNESELKDENKSKKGFERELKTVLDQISSYEKVLAQYQKSKNVQTEYDSVKSELDGLLTKVDEMEKNHNSLTEEFKKLPTVSKESVERLTQTVDNLSSDVEKDYEKKNDLASSIAVFKERAIYLNEKVDREKENVTRYKTMLLRSEELAASVQMLTDFRQDRIDNAVPAIEAYASDLLGRFTDGKFIKLTIDAKFRINVTLMNGTVYPVGLLSGGELSAAAMALRLAVSMMLNFGSSKNLLILDEVLVSQDQVRAELILNAIKEVCEGQVILIAHNGNIDSVVDRVMILDEND